MTETEKAYYLPWMESDGREKEKRERRDYKTPCKWLIQKALLELSNKWDLRVRRQKGKDQALEEVRSIQRATTQSTRFTGLQPLTLSERSPQTIRASLYFTTGNVTVPCFSQEASSLSSSDTEHNGPSYKTDQGHIGLCSLFFCKILNFNIITQNAQEQLEPNTYNPIPSSAACKRWSIFFPLDDRHFNYYLLKLT